MDPRSASINEALMEACQRFDRQGQFPGLLFEGCDASQDSQSRDG